MKPVSFGTIEDDHKLIWVDSIQTIDMMKLDHQSWSMLHYFNSAGYLYIYPQ